MRKTNTTQYGNLAERLKERSAPDTKKSGGNDLRSIDDSVEMVRGEALRHLKVPRPNPRSPVNSATQSPIVGLTGARTESIPPPGNESRHPPLQSYIRDIKKKPDLSPPAFVPRPSRKITESVDGVGNFNNAPLSASDKVMVGTSVLVTRIINVGEIKNERDREPEMLTSDNSFLSEIKSLTAVTGGSELAVLIEKAKLEIPGIIDMVKNTIKPKMVEKDIRSWKDADVSARIKEITEKILRMLKRHMESVPVDKGESQQLKVFRLCFRDGYEIIYEMLREKMEKAVRTIVVETRTRERVKTIPMLPLEYARETKLPFSFGNDHETFLDTTPVRVGESLTYTTPSPLQAKQPDNMSPPAGKSAKSTILPPPANRSGSREQILSLKQLAELTNEQQHPEREQSGNSVTGINLKGSDQKQTATKIFDNDTSQIDELWDTETVTPTEMKAEEVPMTVKNVESKKPEQRRSLPEPERKDTRGVEQKQDEYWEVLTQEDIIAIEEPIGDSLTPVVYLNDEDVEEDNSALNVGRFGNAESGASFMATLGSVGNAVNKRRIWVSAAVLAMIAGGGSLLLKSQKDMVTNTDMTVAYKGGKDKQIQMGDRAAQKLHRHVKSTDKQKTEKVENYSPSVSPKTLGIIERIPDRTLRNNFKKMFSEGEFAFNDGNRNTVDQLMKPFYQIANPQQKLELDKLAVQFNTGLYAHAIAKFRGLTQTEKRRLLHGSNPSDTDAQVYRALHNSKYGDPSKWDPKYKGKPYDTVFGTEKRLYERFQNEIVEMSDCRMVFQTENRSPVPVFNNENGRFNVIVESAAAIIFGTDFYQPVKKTATARAGNHGSAEIPVYWENEEK